MRFQWNSWKCMTLLFSNKGIGMAHRSKSNVRLCKVVYWKRHNLPPGTNDISPYTTHNLSLTKNMLVSKKGCIKLALLWASLYTSLPIIVGPSLKTPGKWKQFSNSRYFKIYLISSLSFDNSLLRITRSEMQSCGGKMFLSLRIPVF